MKHRLVLAALLLVFMAVSPAWMRSRSSQEVQSSAADAAHPWPPAAVVAGESYKPRWDSRAQAHQGAPAAAAEPPRLAHEAAVSLTQTIPVEQAGVQPAAVPGRWQWNDAGEVTVPVLLYHHVAEKSPPGRYFVSPDDFAAQMKRLHDYGYTGIPLSLLVQAMEQGAYLPPRPVVITFDDGYRDVFDNAYPVMQGYGYTGVVYVITGQVGKTGYQDNDQLKTLLAEGWEVGSHTISHANLRQPGVDVEAEVVSSRKALEELVQVAPASFSFPYGLTTPAATQFVKEAGYQNAVGLGGLSRHNPRTRFYLSRIEVQGTIDLQVFTSLLPWSGPLSPRQAAPEYN